MNLQLDRLDKLHYTLVMEKIQFLTLFKKPAFILGLILLIFFLKGVFLAVLFPIFGGQDEARHYNTIQYLSEPENLNIVKNSRPNERGLREKDDFSTYNFSEEIQKAAEATDTNNLRGDIFNKIDFSTSYDGKNESGVNSKTWKQYNYYFYPDIVVGKTLYHKIGSLIEKNLSNQNILVRFYSIRIFSVLLGTFVVLFSYLIAKNIGFSAKHSLILAAIVSFQPRLSIYFTNINYDVLFILSFVLFTYASVLALKKGLDWKNMTLLIATFFLGLFTKETGAILLIAFAIMLIFFSYKNIKEMNKRIRWLSFFISLFIIVFLLIFLKRYFPSDVSYNLPNILSSIGEYMYKYMSPDKLISPSGAYWGLLGWTNSWILKNFINYIWIIETFAAIGLAIFLFSKKKFDFLPEKKYILFLAGMIVLLQAGIRFADWLYFYKLGQIELGTPGRYFIPNLTAHIILVFTGIGALFGYFKKGKLFDYSLIIGLILMMAFMMYTIFDVIIYRYYL